MKANPTNSAHLPLISQPNQLFMTLHQRNLCSLLGLSLACLVVSHSAAAAESYSIRKLRSKSVTYQNPFDKISDDNVSQLTDHISAQTRLEFEKNRLKDHYSSNINTEHNEPSSRSLEVDLNIQFQQNLSAVITVQAEQQGSHSTTRVDENKLVYEGDVFEFQLGRFYLPFTEVQSYFITDPILGFAETKASSLLVGYSVIDNLQARVMILKSNIGSQSNNRNYDYALSINWLSDDKRLHFNVAYLSDLAESDEEFLEDFNNLYQTRVGALSASLLLVWSDFEIRTQIVQAERSFRELDTNSNKPTAKNLEIAWYPRPNLQLAYRYETSSELEDAAKTQQGLSLGWWLSPRVEVAFDYLTADFKHGFVEDNDGNILQSSDRVAGKLTIEF